MEFDHALRSELTRDGLEIARRPRPVIAHGYCKIALEHCSGALTLFADDNPTGALALARLQYEAVLRGSWTLFTATDEWIEKFAGPIPDNFGKEPEQFPNIYRMLEQIQNTPGVPANVYTSLNTLKVKALDSFNSYTHGGLRSIKRVLDGYEPELISWTIRTSSSLAYFASVLLARVAEDPVLADRIGETRKRFSYCMHE